MGSGKVTKGEPTPANGIDIVAPNLPSTATTGAELASPAVAAGDGGKAMTTIEATTDDGLNLVAFGTVGADGRLPTTLLADAQVIAMSPISASSTEIGNSQADATEISTNLKTFKGWKHRERVAGS
jgi:hypothetical protein